VKVPVVVSGLLSRLRPSIRNGEQQSSSPIPNLRNTWGDDDLELKLRTLLADKESKSHGIVQAVTLHQFREDLGDLWNKHEKSILLIAETTIDRMLGKGQTSIRDDDYSWLLVTPDLTPNEAQGFANSIASVIGEKLVGARFEETDGPDPTPLTGMVDLSDAMTPDGAIHREAFQHAVASARSHCG
jgi:hypothetical protein